MPADPTSIDDVHYTNEKLEELMSGYKENQQLAAKMFEERKRDMMETGTNTFIKPGDENSKYYTKPDESPISHPAEVLERLQKEKPDAPMEELIKEADAIVAKEIEERKKKREAEEEEVNSTEAQIKEDGEVEKGEEVESK